MNMIFKNEIAKKAFTPRNRVGAMSLLDQAKKAMLDGKCLPDHVANYLLNAIYRIEDGEEADLALGLRREKKRPKTNKGRDLKIALRVREIQSDGTSVENAKSTVASEFKLSESGIDSARRNAIKIPIKKFDIEHEGKSYRNLSDVEFYDMIKDDYGEEVAENFLLSLMEREG